MAREVDPLTLLSVMSYYSPNHFLTFYEDDILAASFFDLLIVFALTILFGDATVVETDSGILGTEDHLCDLLSKNIMLESFCHVNAKLTVQQTS
jgi:hypothetical protein